MEDLSEAFGLNQRASALDPETVSETDVSHGKHQTDPIQGMSSKAAESGQGSSDLCNLGEKKNEKTDKVDRPADDDEGPGIEPNQPEQRRPSEDSASRHIIQVHQDGITALRWIGTQCRKTSCHKGRRRIRFQDSPRGDFIRTSTPSRVCRAPSVRAPGSPPRRLHRHSIPYLGVDRQEGGRSSRQRRHSRWKTRWQHCRLQQHQVICRQHVGS